ncbi:MAG TPA: dihydrodipicolinate synthase family protein [Blastocatellia bacterium]|nr:dihydrodipicolinate synthase family protein [Blastocatellia bacterium]
MRSIDPVELRSRLSGVVAFPVTPFKSDLSLNLAGLRRNLEKLLEQQVCAIVAAGGTGEMYSLTPTEHLDVIKATVEATRRRVPVVAGVGFNQALATEMANAAASTGADGILAFPPYYPQSDDDGLLEYYRAIGRATQLGLLIYSRDWANFSPAMVERLTQIPTLCAWKDGQGDLRRFQAIINRVGDRLRWISGAGDDTVPGYYSIGIRCFTSSIATVAPRLSLKLHELGASGARDDLAELMHRCVIPLYALRARRKGYEVSAMKALMDMAGLSGGPVRPPLVEVRLDEKEELRAVLETWKAFL